MGRPRIRISVTGRLGPRGCHRGHQPGDSFDFDAERGRICPLAMHVAFLYADILRYGGTLPGEPAGTARFCCPDADTANVFLIERLEDGDELRAILRQFAASGWPLIAAPAQAWLDGAGDRAALTDAIRQAERECGSCGCALDPLYPRALALLG